MEIPRRVSKFGQAKKVSGPAATQVEDDKRKYKRNIDKYGDFYLLYKDIQGTLRFNRFSANQLQMTIIVIIGVFGFASISLLIATNVNSSHFNAVSYVSQYLSEDEDKTSKDITIVGSPRYLWIPRYIFGEEHLYRSYTSRLPVETAKNIVIADRGFMNVLAKNTGMQSIYDDTSPIASFRGDPVNYDTKEYPFTSMRYSGPDQIQIRSSFGN